MLNAKSKPVPAAWRPRFDEFLKKIGYRFVLREMSHALELSGGEPLTLRTRWDNIGVAPDVSSVAPSLPSALQWAITWWRSGPVMPR